MTSNHFVLLFLCCIGYLQAQTQKGDLLIGGSTKLGLESREVDFEINNDSYLAYKNTAVDLHGMVGIFLVNNLATGIELSFFSLKDEDHLLFRSKETLKRYLVSPFARYYFKSEKIKPYLQASVGFGSSKSKTEQDDSIFDSEWSNTLTSYHLVTGLEVFLNEKVAVDINFRYGKLHSNDDDYDEKTIETSTGLLIGFNLHL